MEDKIRVWFANMRIKVTNMWIKVKDWVARNSGTIIRMLPMIVSAVISIYRFSAKKKIAKNDEMHRTQTIYDRRQGHYWVLVREPTPSEWHMIESRYNNGESYYDILASMRLL